MASLSNTKLFENSLLAVNYSLVSERTGAHSYGFNGKEKDDEVEGAGNEYDFGARIYDPRIGRWLSIDPQARKYPFFSPYLAFGDNPLLFTDPGGETLRVAGKDAQEKAQQALQKEFGEKASDFSFDPTTNDLKFTGNPASYKGTERDVLDGVIQVINHVEVTNIVYAKTPETAANGGEVTKNTTDFPSQKENIITIDPAEDVTNKPEIYKKTKYVREDGTTTTNPTDPRIKFNNNGTAITDGYVEIPIVSHNSRESRFFHGLGHILFRKNSEQENVIGYDNKARANWKSPLEVEASPGCVTATKKIPSFLNWSFI